MVITSVREGGPTCAKEALACGLPVVSVDVGDRDLFLEVPEAMTRVVSRAYDLALALRRAVRSPDVQRKSHLPPWLEMDSAVGAYLQVYRRALEKTRSGGSER
jgi:glycosyltransferase involved in cell wall biosynthesis